MTPSSTPLRPTAPQPSPAPFRLLDLPNELVLEIAHHLPHGSADALRRTSRHLSRLLAGPMSRRAYTAVLPGVGSTLRWALLHGRHALARRLLAGDRRGALVPGPAVRDVVVLGSLALPATVLTCAVFHMRDGDAGALAVLRALVAAGARADWGVLFLAALCVTDRAAPLGVGFARAVVEVLLEAQGGPGEEPKWVHDFFRIYHSAGEALEAAELFAMLEARVGK